jgi:hypothetical protein
MEATTGVAGQERALPRASPGRGGRAHVISDNAHASVKVCNVNMTPEAEPEGDQVRRFYAGSKR